MSKFIPFYKLAIASGIAKLLGWCGAALLGVGIHLSYEPGAPGQVADILVGLMLMGVHAVGSHVTLKAAQGSLPDKPLPFGVTKPLVAFAALLFCVPVLTGCASFTGASYTYTTDAGASVTLSGFGAWCENNLTVIRAATKTSITITAQVLIKTGATTARIAGYVRDVLAVLRPLLSQASVSQADLTTALAQAKIKDASGIYANAIEPAIDLVAGYIVQLKNEGAPAKVIIDVLTALVNGLNDAANALDPTGANASAPHPVAVDNGGSFVYSF